MILLYIMSNTGDANDFVESNLNNAQIYLDGLLNISDPDETFEIRFDVPVDGDIDFSGLKDKHFRKVDSIVFQQPGQVTALRNIPEKVIYIECADQLLTALDNLPAALEELYVQNNKIVKFNGNDCPKLRILNISGNELTHLDKLPSTLETLECENNQLRSINLEKAQGLKTLKVSNNPLLTLEHVPPSLVNIEMENNPFTEIEREDGTKKDKKKQEKKVEYLDGLNTYFRLKNDYEKKLLKMKRTAFEKGHTRKEGLKFAREVKPVCIHCKRKVGSLFFIKDDTYYAVCGDKLKPCDLSIKIYRGDYFQLDEVMEMEQDEVRAKKEQMIQLKMNSLFKYISHETMKIEFKRDLEEYNEDSALHKQTLAQYDKLYNNTERRSHTVRKQEDVYRIQQDVERLFNEYMQTDNREILNACVEMQIKDLIPALKNLRWMKYDTMLMEDDETTGVSTLVQREVSIHHKDYIIGKGPAVLKFVV